MRPLIPSLLCLILLTSAATASPATSFREHALATIDFDDGYSLIHQLSSPEFAGRMTGQPGQWQTAQLAADRFAAIGLQPLGDAGTFLQHFDLATNIIHEASLTVNEESFTFGTDFISRLDGGSGKVRGEAVFVGRGISAPEQGFDEYAGVDVHNKVAVALRGGHPKVEGDWGLTGWKVRAARDHGAAGLILLDVSADGTFGGLIGSVYFSNGDIPWDPGFPAIQGNHRVAHALFDPSGLQLPALIRLSNEERTTISAPLGCEVDLRVRGTMELSAPTCNVVGFLEGSDPALRQEVMVIGGHMDHVGLMGDEFLFCGQEDNASGTASVLELAQAFATAPERPKRSLLFILFTGEEMGLLGARHWIEHPALPLARVRAMFNFDMTGQGDTFMLHNGDRTPHLRSVAEQMNRRLYQLPFQTNDVAAASDHVPFWGAGIPAVMVLNGGDRKYPVHQLGTFQEDGCNWPLWEQVTETMALTIWELANTSRLTDRVPQAAQLAALADLHQHDHGAAAYHACW